MEFKITHETTLYELQEHCKKIKCENCELCGGYDTCQYNNVPPEDWNIQKPKTYKEDFLEKFPNARMQCGVLVACRRNIYADVEDCNGECAKCWNEIMEE